METNVIYVDFEKREIIENSEESDTSYQVVEYSEFCPDDIPF